MTEYDAYVAENLGGPDERAPPLYPGRAGGSRMQPAERLLALLRRRGCACAAQGFGFADEEFHQRKPEKGLLTKREVRAFSFV